ncbi:helix-turn-helix domain-containing protein [Neobacillus cucumis]|uniref:helix-turn-helix domain-containing protein n=1 Tax=Neobacillus cucumis TaxID=1740721 RepID=UPI00203B96D2|nr:helix-turn-helix transcriptional regulator [Neobacillus cucumis]MCM3727353.1 helix-turn-helix domain-containing protein [Neobacillus cucumis]
MLERLSVLRKERKWSLQETADKLGIAKSTYAGYESGYREPSLHSLLQIAGLFDTTVDYLLGAEKDDTIEITDFAKSHSHRLSIDGELLSVDELNDFVSFVRVKRILSAKGMSKEA